MISQKMTQNRSIKHHLFQSQSHKAVRASVLAEAQLEQRKPALRVQRLTHHPVFALPVGHVVDARVLVLHRQHLRLGKAEQRPEHLRDHVGSLAAKVLRTFAQRPQDTVATVVAHAGVGRREKFVFDYFR